MTPVQIYTYEVRAMGERWQARQSLNGSLLKCVFRNTEEAAQDQCKAWKEVRK